MDPQLIAPGLAGAAVFGDGDGVGAGGEAVCVEGAFEVVDFVGDEAGEGAVEGGDVAGAVGVLVFDVDGEGAGDVAADVEEGQAAFVLGVGVHGLVDDLGVEEGDEVAVGGADDGGGAVDADLGCGQAHAFGEGVGGGDAVEGGAELGGDAAGVFGFGG